MTSHRHLEMHNICCTTSERLYPLPWQQDSGWFSVMGCVCDRTTCTRMRWGYSDIRGEKVMIFEQIKLFFLYIPSVRYRPPHVLIITRGPLTDSRSNASLSQQDLKSAILNLYGLIYIIASGRCFYPKTYIYLRCIHEILWKSNLWTWCCRNN